jgi:hypothetical protein
MSDNTQILIRALEASGSQREADLARAILGDPAAATPAEPPATPAPAVGADGLTPGQRQEQQRQAAAGVQGAGELPEGLMSVAEVQEHERNPNPKGLSYTQRMELGERYIKSAEHHIKEGTI